MKNTNENTSIPERGITGTFTMMKGYNWSDTEMKYLLKEETIRAREIRMSVYADDKSLVLRFIGGPTGHEEYRLDDRFLPYLQERYIEERQKGQDCPVFCICGGTVNSWAKCTVPLGRVIEFIQDTLNKCAKEKAMRQYLQVEAAALAESAGRAGAEDKYSEGGCHPQGCLMCPDRISGCNKPIPKSDGPDYFVGYNSTGRNTDTGSIEDKRVVSWACSCGGRHDVAFSIPSDTDNEECSGITDQMVERAVTEAPETFCKTKHVCKECNKVFYRPALLTNTIMAWTMIEAAAELADVDKTTALTMGLLADRLLKGTICKTCATG